MIWTEEKIEQLTKLHEDKKSGSQIAAEMGCGLTRNAVIGKLHRMGRHTRREPRLKIPSVKPTPNFNPLAKGVGHYKEYSRTDTVPAAIESIPGGVSIMDVGSYQCRAIIGHDPDGHKLARYCGAPVIGAESFCQGHYDLYYYTPPRKR